MDFFFFLEVEKGRVDNLRDGGEKHANISRSTLQDSRWRKREKLWRRGKGGNSKRWKKMGMM